MLFFSRILDFFVMSKKKILKRTRDFWTFRYTSRFRQCYFEFDKGQFNKIGKPNCIEIWRLLLERGLFWGYREEKTNFEFKKRFFHILLFTFYLTLTQLREKKWLNKSRMWMRWRELCQLIYEQQSRFKLLFPPFFLFVP